MLEYYSGSVVKALSEIYPEIGLDANKFLLTSRMYPKYFFSKKEAKI